MTKASTTADLLWPYLVKKVEKVARSNGNGSAGSGSIGGAPTPHAMQSPHHTGAISNLQGPQFLLLDGTRTLTGHLPVAAGKTIDGVDISVHAADPDAHHARVTVGDGLGLVGQLIDIDLAANSKLEFSGGDLRLDLDADFVWLGIHQFEQDIQVAANISFIGGDRAIVASDDLYFDLGGDLILDDADTFRSSDFLDGIPIAGFSLHQNSGGKRQLTINTLKADEAHFRALVFDTARVDVGEEYWGKTVGIIHDDFVTPASIGGTVTIVFEDSPIFVAEIFEEDEWALMRVIDADDGFLAAYVWGQVSDYTNLGLDDEGRGHQSWTFTLRDGPTSVTVKKSNEAVGFGFSGQGYAHLSVLQSADGPWFRIGTWSGANPYTLGNNQIRSQLGLLDGIADAVLNPAGYGLYSDNAYLKGIVSAANDVVRLDGDGIRIKGQPAAYDELYSYEFQNTAGTELGGLYVRYTDSTTDSASIELVAFGSTGIRPVIGVQASSALSGLAGSPLIDIRAVNSDTSVQASITMDVSPTVATMVIAASDFVSFTGLVKTTHLRPVADDAYDLGSASFRWNTVYADNLIISGSISGAILSGAEWQHSGNMVIDANDAGNTIVSVANQGAGRADLDVDRNIILGGTIDGVDLAAHVLLANAHHDAVTAGSGISVATQVVSVDSTVVRTSRTVATGDGLSGGGDLSANRTLTVDSSVVRTTRDLIAGLGLTGGGTLAADRTFDVGAGDGISVAANAVAVDSSVVRTSRTLASGGGLTGGGDLSANRTLAVGAGDGITVNIDDVAVDSTVVRTSRQVATGTGLSGGGDLSANRTLSINQAFTPTWTGMHQFNVDIQLNANLDFVGGIRSITSDSTNNLIIAPGGDLELNPTGTDVLPGGSIAIDLGDYNRKWRTLFAAELYVETLVAQDVMATIGGRVMVAPTTTLIADVSSGATSIDVKHDIFNNGSYIILQTAPGGVAQFEAMKITTSTPTVITGGFRFTVTRNLDGTGANAWVAGDAVVSTGLAVGEGYIDLTSTSTIHNHLGPTITIYSRTATTNWNDVKPVVSMGNLESFVDYSAAEFGFAVGNDLTLDAATGFSGLTADRTNGLRLFNTDLSWIDTDDSTWVISGNEVIDGLHFTQDGVTALRLATNQAVFSGIVSSDDLMPSGTIYVGAGGLNFTLGASMEAIIFGHADGVEIQDGSLFVPDGDVVVGKRLRATYATVTIAGGAITATGTFHAVITEASASTDDLDNINGGTLGAIIILMAEDGADTVVIRDGVGNISCPANRSLTSVDDMWMGIYNGARWCEIAFADNAA